MPRTPASPRTPRGRGSAGYYYVQGEKIPVTRRDDLIAVQFHSRARDENFETFNQARSDMLEPIDEYSEMQSSNLRIYRVANSRSESDLRSALEEIRGEDDVENVGHVYTNEHGQPLVLTDEIVAKFKSDLTSDRIEALQAERGLETVERLGFADNAFVLRVKPDAKRDALAIANELVEKGEAEYAYPNFIEHVGYRAVAVEAEARDEVRTADPLFAQQWHHQNTGQPAGGVAGTPGADIRTPAAWTTTMGNNAIRLAVLDGGTDIAHNDLNSPGKSVDPIDFMVTPPDTNPVGGAHGTQVAGMAVATANNGVVGAGSAPNCRLIAIKAGDTIAQVLMAKGFAYAADHGADVITCSLGPVGPWIMTDALRDAIDYATTYGRGGRGCVYTQAVDNSPNAISVDQVSAYERSIAVSRTNNRDTYDGAALGPELDVSAPGRNVLTITNTTATDANTSAVVTGTSFATPLTAGVACLVLSTNPALSWEEVRQVLMDSADKIDAAAMPYVPAPATRPPGTRNDRLGYGRINALGAVHRAQAGSTRDLFVRDTTSDTGSVPQPAWGFWDSPDVWVRNVDDGGTTHQDTIRGQDNFLHCRVTNRGSEASLPCWVRFYITSFAGVEFRYPFDYKPDTSNDVAGHSHPGNLRPASQFPTPASYLVGTQRIQSIPAGGNVIAKVTWPGTLIPPATNWHPCLLVEVSPHDGPLPAGEHVWENNNLGQKNITIVNARRGQRIVFPFVFGHPQLKGRFLQLDVRKTKAPRDIGVFLAPKDPRLVTAIAKLANVSMPGRSDTLEAESDVEIASSLPIASPLSGGSAGSSWRVTFIEEARIAVSTGDDRSDAEALVFDFPRGSSVEFGRGRLSDVIAEEMPEAADGDLENGRVEGRPAKSLFSVAMLDGTPVIALAPRPVLTPVKVPLRKAGRTPANLVVEVPETAIPGDTYILDVAERTSVGELAGGVRLRVNVVD